MPLARKVVAEFIGTFWLVFGGCGSAVLAAGFMTGAPDNIHMGIGFLGVSLAFGLTRIIHEKCLKRHRVSAKML